MSEMEAPVKRRVTLILLAVLLTSAGIGARLVWLQIFRSEELRARASRQHWRQIEVPATRGSIVDRHGRELALSLKTASLFAHPRRVEEPETAARLLAPVIGLSRGEILRRLSSDKPFVYLERFLEPDQVEAVRALDLPIGEAAPFGFLPSSKRYYPRGRLGVHVVGFANIDGEGVEGIEREYDAELSGDPTVHLVLQDGLNGQVRQKTIRRPDKLSGDVVLTLDVVLQHRVERELDRAIRETGAAAASALLLDPVTGQLIALANRPAADPNRYGSATDGQRVNRALVHQYEPGSTFKVVAMAAALEHGAVRPEQRFDCENGLYAFRGRRIRDISRHDVLTAREVLEKSSNVGMVKITERLKPADLRATIDRFGFGRRSGIGLPGESPGRLPALGEWSAQTRPSLAFGYEVGVTVLQMASALGVIANDGVRVAPRIVLGVRDPVGRLRREHPATPRRVIGARAARELTAMMEGVVRQGTGTRARLDGYRLAAKSGTARKLVDGKYSETDYIASFGGFAPVSTPRLVGLVVIDSPRGEHYGGGQVAAPVFRRIMQSALGHLRVPRDDGTVTLAGMDAGGQRTQDGAR